MISRISGSGIALSFIRHRGAQAVVLLLMGCTLAVSVLSLAAVRDTAHQAIEDSLRADLGQRAYALQTGNPQAIAVLRQLQWASPVQDTNGDVTFGGLSDSVTIRATTDSSLNLGILTEGTRPQRAGEAMLTQSTAKALGIKLGDEISVNASRPEERSRVVGLSVDPALPSNRVLIELVDGSDSFTPTKWLSDTDFYAEPRMKPFLDARTASYRSIGTLVESADQNRPQFLSSMRFLPAGAGLLMAVILLSAVVVMSRVWNSYTNALIAAGMSRAMAWRRIYSTVFGLLLLGEIFGGMVGITLLSRFRVPVSSWFGQHWITISPPTSEPIFLGVLTVLSGVAAIQAVRLAPAWVSWSVARRSREIKWATPTAAVAFGVAVAVWAAALHFYSQSQDNSTRKTLVVSAAVAATAVATTIPFLISALIGYGLPPVTRIVLRRVLGSLRPVLATGAVIVFASAAWSAQTTYDANTGEAGSSPLEPAGSFVISAVPDSALSSLASIYHAHGGSQIHAYQIPDETKMNLRVSSTKFVECMSNLRTTNPNDVPGSCAPQQAATSINTVMIGAPGSTPRADPKLLQDGKVGLLFFPADSGSVARVATTSAEPDPTLGGNIPGLVVPPESNVVKEFSLESGGTSEVLLLDFNRLTPNERSSVRAAVMRLAAGAETADGTDPTAYDRLRSVANTVSSLGAVAAAIVLLLGGASTVIAHELLRRTLIDLGAASAPRRRFMVRLATVPVITMALTIPLAILTASIGGDESITSYGRLWLLPAVVALLASAVVAAAFIRVPAPANETAT